MFFTKFRSILLGLQFFILSANSLWAKESFEKKGSFNFPSDGIIEFIADQLEIEDSSKLKEALQAKCAQLKDQPNLDEYRVEIIYYYDAGKINLFLEIDSDLLALIDEVVKEDFPESYGIFNGDHVEENFNWLEKISKQFLRKLQKEIALAH
jgi:hypothetical protein